MANVGVRDLRAGLSVVNHLVDLDRDRAVPLLDEPLGLNLLEIASNWRRQ